MFVTMNSEIFPKASYCCFCLSKLPFFTCAYFLYIANKQCSEYASFFKENDDENVRKLHEKPLLESIGKFYILYNGDGSVVASTPTRNYLLPGLPDNNCVI